MLAEAGLVGIIMATSPEYVAPHGAKQPIFGTNPICCAVPTSRGLMLMDQATAAFAWFGLLEAKTAGRKIPNDIAWDKNGNQTDDPSEALQGALRTFDRGYKSSNLAMMVELIAGKLWPARNSARNSALSPQFADRPPSPSPQAPSSAARTRTSSRRRTGATS